MKVAFVTPELQSLVHRTNLASVAEALAIALRRAGADVRVFIPCTLDVSHSESLGYPKDIGRVQVADAGGTVRFKVLETNIGDLPIYLFDHPSLFGTRHPYGNEEGPYPDNWRRYALFARAVLEGLELTGFDADIVHCLDWTTGLVPVFQRLEYADKDLDHPASRVGTWFGVHNLAIQGQFEREILPRIGIPHRAFCNVGGVELAGKVNFLKAGVEFATIVGTHSPTHARKIQERDRGYGMEEVFRRRRKELVGITSGIDYSTWNPANDPLLPATFSQADRDLAGKRKCKAALQSALKLDNGPRTPVGCSIGRWDADNGFDLVSTILNEILESNVELVIMGQGLADIAQRLKTLEESYLGRIRVIDAYQSSTAHLILGGSDFLLLPAHYQPSNPLFAIAMRYGVVPLVYANSGLEDSVSSCTPDGRKGTGFHFEPYTEAGLMGGIDLVVKSYRDLALWKKLQMRCLKQDFSWDATAREYVKAYRRVKRRVGTRS